MEPAGANLGRFPSKFLLMVIPAVIASGVVALVLYAVHVSRTPSSSEVLSDLTPQGDGLSAEERRGLTRQMLKARRENPEEPAQVRPMPTSRPVTTGVADDPAVDAPPVAPAVDGRTAPDRTPAAAPLPAARPAIARARPEPIAVVAAPAVPAAASGAPAPQSTASTQSPSAPLVTVDPALLPPVTVTAPTAAAEPEPQPRGFAANVFSSFSTFAGTAANATGNTVNWVIDLPGKAISAGGKLFGGDSAASNQPAASPPPAAAPPPATAPPPKRNL